MSLLGQIGGGLVGFATGGIGGAIAGWQQGGALTTPHPSSPAGPSSPFGQPGGFQMPFPVTGPGGQTLPGFSPAPSSGAGCPKGYHLNKHALAATHRHGALPAHTLCVRNRKMQPLNSRAITRSLRRIKRANKIVRKLHAFSQPRRIAAGGARAHRAGCGCVVCRRR